VCPGERNDLPHLALARRTGQADKQLKLLRVDGSILCATPSAKHGQRPNYRLYRVPTQLLQRRKPLIASDDNVSVRLAFGRHHHDELSCSGASLDTAFHAR